RFVPESEFANALAESAGAFLPVILPAPQPADRGRLALLVEEAIEVALERHGGSPPGLTMETDLDGSLADQLYRARLLEFRGIALALGPLTALAGAAGVLDVEDSAVLRFWCDAPNGRAVRVLLATENANVGVYGPPCPLADLLPQDVNAAHDADAPDSDAD